MKFSGFRITFFKTSVFSLMSTASAFVLIVSPLFKISKSNSDRSSQIRYFIWRISWLKMEITGWWSVTTVKHKSYMMYDLKTIIPKWIACSSFSVVDFLMSCLLKRFARIRIGRLKPISLCKITAPNAKFDASVVIMKG